MAGFCIYCGKPLENNACTCDDFQAAARQAMAQQAAAQQQAMAQQQAAARQQAMAQQQMWQGMPQNGQPDMYMGGYTQNNYGENVKKQFSNSKGMFVDFIKNPISMMSKVYTGADKRTAILMGVFHMLIFVLICLTKIPMLEFSDKFGIGLKIAVAVGVFVALHALIIYGFAKYRHIPINLTSAIGVFCVATIPSSAFIIAAWLMSYVSWLVCGLCLMLGMLAWIVLMTDAVKVVLQLDNDIVFWITLLVMAIVIIITGIVAKQIVMGIAKQLAVGAITKSAKSLLGGLGSIF